MASNEGYANLAAALLNFFGSRARSRREDRREREKSEREERRHAELMGLRRDELSANRDLRKDAMGLEREKLDRVHPKKTWYGDLFDTMKGMVAPSPQDQLARAQAGLIGSQGRYFDAMAGQVGRGMTPPYAPGMPKMPGIGMVPGARGQVRQPKAPKEQRMELASPEDFIQTIADALITGTQSGFRQSGHQFDPNSTDWKSVVQMNKNMIAKKMGRMPTDQELAAILFAITGGTDPNDPSKQIPGRGNFILLPKKY